MLYVFSLVEARHSNNLAQGVAIYGWITFVVKELSHTWVPAATTPGDITTVTILRMQGVHVKSVLLGTAMVSIVISDIDA